MNQLDDTQWLEAQYNNRARVPDHAAIFERWREASRVTREQSRCELDVSYGDGADERLDVFLTTVPNAPVLIFIHGGYWRAFDKSDQSFIAPSFTADGAVVLVPNYSLCPAVTIEQIALQMTRVVAWAWHHAGEFGGDESDEFLRQTQLIRDQWGPTAVPVSETLVGHHHFDMLHNLADPAGRLHDLALRLLELH